MATVFAGLSGGVDSAVSAALLKEQGHNVVGAFIKIWQPEFIECTWKEDRLDAMRVAVALGIPFREIDLSESYQKHVVQDMLLGYERGITPNPDVLCNARIKFGEFFDWARGEGADFIATGHYARIQENNDLRSRYLLRGKDAAKDQSYFLYALSEDVLARTLFPIGGMTKQEVRAKARHFNLPNAARPDSQGLCFVGEVSMKDFLARFIRVERGPVIDVEGRLVGEHEGAALYTIGQRHGFRTRRDGNGSQYYVVAVDAASNTIRVSKHREDAACFKISLMSAHWIHEKPAFPFHCEVETRYRETPVRAEIREEEEGLGVQFKKPHIAAPGQSLVMYDGAHVLGGGIIQKSGQITADS